MWQRSRAPFQSECWTVRMAISFSEGCSPAGLLADDDPVAAWFGRCLDLHDCMGRKMAAAT